MHIILFVRKIYRFRIYFDVYWIEYEVLMYTLACIVHKSILDKKCLWLNSPIFGSNNNQREVSREFKSKDYKNCLMIRFLQFPY